MARSRNPDHYPEEYGKMAEACALRDESFAQDAGTGLQAAKLRGHFYGWVGAVRREAAAARKKLEAGVRPSPKEEHWMNMEAFCDRTLVTIEGTLVTFQNRNQSWQAKAAREMLKNSTKVAGGVANAMLDAPPLPEGVVICPTCKQFPCGCRG